MASNDAADTSRMAGFYSARRNVGGKLLRVDNGVEFSRQEGNRTNRLEQAVAVIHLEIAKTNSHTWVRTPRTVRVDPLHSAFKLEAVGYAGMTKTITRWRRNDARCELQHEWSPDWQRGLCSNKDSHRRNVGDGCK